ncbi:MAG TPA: metallophosphoesterase [Terriglobales bacterium]|nr:metallophosphoesterase [Terriglobales bacterium]
MKIAIIGDPGTGGNRQRDIAERLQEARQLFPFTAVFMLGDNLYGRERPKDYLEKFEKPYSALLNSGVKFYAVLGNHDTPEQRMYPGFNMGGKRYYSFDAAPGVRVFALDTTDLNDAQIRWIRQELARPGANWKIVIMHHPLYSSGKRHGPELGMREVLEPIFVDAGVNLVFSGHEHFYERHTAQRGIQYFISGAAGKLRKNGIRAGDGTACGFDQDNSFMLLEVGPDAAYFASVARDGTVVDSGEIIRKASQLQSAQCRTPIQAARGAGRK